MAWVSQEIAGQLPPANELGADDLNRKSLRIQARLKHGERPSRIVIEAMALASHATEKVLGYRPNRTQILAALLLADGKIVELRAGEGKTLIALLAAYWKALQGQHVDIVTSNDYLAQRDQRWLGLIYGMLGLSPGVIISTTQRGQRKKEYEKHVTYVANQEIGFDYLRDHLAKDPKDQVLGKLEFAIIDEVDSILIDEARTPLVITELGREEELQEDFSRLKEFVELIRNFDKDQDYTADLKTRSVAFTDSGIQKIVDSLGKNFFSEENVNFARQLWYALYISVFLKEDRDYTVVENKVVLVNEFTGHAMPDHRFFNGMQQALEAKAGVPISKEDKIVASITYRNFFRLFKGISGMTGTAYDAEKEFRDLYRLEVVVIPPYHGSERKDLPTQFFIDEKGKLAAIIRLAQKTKKDGMPLLIVGKSIASAKAISEFLLKSGVEHQLLHANVAKEEAAIIEKAGKTGVITVATNMAGRGADIIIDESLRYNRGLRVLGAEHNLAHRVDEQLRGRAGRQGQAGETIFFASLEDELLQIFADDIFWDYAGSLSWTEEGIADPALQKGLNRAQEIAQRSDAENRLSLAQFDAVIDLHRKTIYALREKILYSEDFITKLFEEIRVILSQKVHRSLQTKDIVELWESGEAPAGLSEDIKKFFLGSTRTLPKFDKNWNLPEARQTILTAIDQEWQSYLEKIETIEDWITITSFNRENPYVSFLEDADRVFHEALKSIILNSLRAILTLIRN